MLNENDGQDHAVSQNKQTRIGKMLSFEWFGQTLASFCWIVSVFVYGFAGDDGLQMSTGDWLQLLAASSWMLSNIAAIIAIKPN